MSWPRVKDSMALNHVTGWKGEVTSPWEHEHSGPASRALTLSLERVGVDSCRRLGRDWTRRPFH